MTAMLIGLSGVGALVKIFNTVALDSMPGYFAALFLGGGYGAVVAGLGHIITSITSGFPLGIPIHIYVALQMAVYSYLFRLIYEKTNIYVGVIIGTLLNGPVAALLLVPILGWGFFAAWTFPLTIASFANICLAFLVFKSINKIGGNKIDREI